MKIGGITIKPVKDRLLKAEQWVLGNYTVDNTIGSSYLRVYVIVKWGWIPTLFGIIAEGINRVSLVGVPSIKKIELVD